MNVSLSSIEREHRLGKPADQIARELRCSKQAVEEAISEIDKREQQRSAQIVEAKLQGWPLLAIAGVTYCARYHALPELPALTPLEYEALKRSIKEKGRVEVAVVVDDQPLPWIIDGIHRCRIAEELGLVPPAIKIEVKAGLSNEEKESLALELNALRRQLTAEKRQAAAIKLKGENRSTREIAEKLGVSHMTVARDLQSVPTVTSVTNGTVERKQEAQKLKEEGKSVREIAEVTGSSKSQVQRDLKPEKQATPLRIDTATQRNASAQEVFSRAEARRNENSSHHPDPAPPKTSAPQIEVKESTPMLETNSIDPKKGAPAILPSGFDGWNTPPDLAAHIRAFGGGEIALDPCSNTGSFVGAKRELTEEQDGLGSDWLQEVERSAPTSRLIYINPPYDMATLEMVSAKAAKLGGVDGLEIIALVPNKSDQAWLQGAIACAAQGVCFISGRLPFWKNKQKSGTAPFACVLLYWGLRSSYFCDHFQKWGVCLDLALYRQAAESLHAH